MPKGVGVQIPPPAQRALSSSGRAPALHAGGGRFESDRVHMDIEDITAGVTGVLMIFVIRAAVISFGGSEAQESIVPEPAPVIQEDRTTAPSPKRADPVEVDELIRIKAVADSVGYPWGARGAEFHFGCPPDADCSCGSSCLLGQIRSRPGSRSSFDIWITENAFKDDKILEFTVLHEMAHLWQVTTRGPDDRYEDFSEWDFGGLDPMEATADCLASAWGGVGYIYYDCPLDAQRYIHQLYLESLR